MDISIPTKSYATARRFRAKIRAHAWRCTGEPVRPLSRRRCRGTAAASPQCRRGRSASSRAAIVDASPIRRRTALATPSPIQRRTALATRDVAAAEPLRRRGRSASSRAAVVDASPIQRRTALAVAAEPLRRRGRSASSRAAVVDAAIRRRRRCDRPRDAAAASDVAAAQVAIIGHGGDTIKAIEAETGAHIKIDRAKGTLSYHGEYSRRADTSLMNRGAAEAATWIFRGDKLRRRADIRSRPARRPRYRAVEAAKAKIADVVARAHETPDYVGAEGAKKRARALKAGRAAHEAKQRAKECWDKGAASARKSPVAF